MSKAERIIAYVMQQLNKIGENFGWQIGRVGPTYENGYTKCNYDSKVHFRKDEIKRDIEKILEEHIPDATKKVVTNADRIRNMSDEELAEFLNVTVYESGENLFCCEDYDKKECCVGGSCRECKVYRVWLKEKVE